MTGFNRMLFAAGHSHSLIHEWLASTYPSIGWGEQYLMNKRGKNCFCYCCSAGQLTLPSLSPIYSPSIFIQNLMENMCPAPLNSSRNKTYFFLSPYKKRESDECVKGEWEISNFHANFCGDFLPKNRPIICNACCFRIAAANNNRMEFHEKIHCQIIC